ncbi:MAG: L-serine ammonia-lyase, iron-sulfur-dependent subunit beta [Coriobacteriia bacterium]|nr:L-serine ammonia-lyase, iron-sulfur-dependent subunit beta [Coriobacteriia bacterium]
MTSTNSLFDIIGPIMIGPSSSHTAGAVRLGALARAISGAQPTQARIGLVGSFAATGAGHGTRLALVAGLLGMSCDDERIADAFQIAAQQGLNFEFYESELEGAHPNTAILDLSSPEKPDIRVIGSSVGGGNVLVTQIDDYEVETDGALPLLVVSHNDLPGVINAVSGVLADAGINIAGMRVSRESRGEKALMLIEMDSLPTEEVAARVRTLKHVRHARIVCAV